MCKLRYPVGIQTFSKIISEGYVYVDKTGYIKPLLSQGHFFFLSRPRRFGKTLLDIEDNKELYEKNQRTLKSFYGNLKSMDSYIRFAFITGVARFSKVGYLFATKGSRLYNPYNVLKALTNKEIEPYRFESGSPIFLARRIRRQGIFPPDINGKKCDREALLAVGLNDRNPIPLMFQTGYLTIADYNYNKDTELYELRFPNLEVAKIRRTVAWNIGLKNRRIKSI